MPRIEQLRKTSCVYTIVALLTYRATKYQAGRMVASMRVALAQINPTVGDLAGNVDRMIRVARESASLQVDTVVFPELSITGYPPRDLVEKESFLSRTESELERLAGETRE